MILTLSGGTGRQRQWVQDALAFCTYPFEGFDGEVTVVWVDEPPCPGHSEYACTVTTGLSSTISIRNTLDDTTKYPPPFGGKLFYMETVIHEFMHAVWFTLASDPTSACQWFFKNVTGDGKVNATAGDYDATGAAWEDRVKESIAEVLKDAFLPETYREGDNRTNWQTDQEGFNQVAHMIGFTGLQGEPGSDTGSYGSGDLYTTSPTWQVLASHEYDDGTILAGFFGSSQIFPDSIPDSAVFGTTNVHLTGHRNCAGGGDTGEVADLELITFVCIVQCDHGHAPPTNFDAAYFPSGSVTDAYPNDGTFNDRIALYLEGQGFAPLGGTWTSNINLTVWPGNDPTKDYYAVAYAIYGCPIFISGTPNYSYLDSIVTNPTVIASKSGVSTPPGPPDLPYTDPTVGGGGGPSGVIRVKSLVGS